MGTEAASAPHKEIQFNTNLDEGKKLIMITCAREILILCLYTTIIFLCMYYYKCINIKNELISYVFFFYQILFVLL